MKKEIGGQRREKSGMISKIVIRNYKLIKNAIIPLNPDINIFVGDNDSGKGETFDRVMILPNGPLQKFVLSKTALAAPEKYYVAVTRPKYSIAIVMDKLPDKLEHFIKVDIIANGRAMEALKFVSNMR